MNVFDQFDATSAGNPFDQFDQPAKKADPKIGNPEDLTFAEKYLAPVLDKLGTAAQNAPVIGDSARVILNNGNARGGAVGRVAMGAADPGIALVQAAANLTPAGDAVNKSIQQTEQQYQAARKEAGSEGFDPLRLTGNVAMTAFGGAALPEIQALSKAPAIVKGGVQGTVQGFLQPVVNGGENFWGDKAKEVGVGAGVGAVAAPVMGLLARIISPRTSVNPDLQLLRKEGVEPTIGQSLGGFANSVEEKAQSLPFVGDAISTARRRAVDQFEQAALRRGADPIGATVNGSGNEGVQDLANKLGAEYERVIPKLSVNVTDPNFVGRMSNLRSMVQSLPESERNQFDSVITREIDNRLAPNGTLSGQNLKDAWNALRDLGNTFSKSDDAYQSQLGQAFKQAFQELKDHVSGTNPATDVAALKNVDFAYANFKRAQRAASSLGAPDGQFTPAQLLNSVKALDRSKDKAAFASGNALMQDLASAGKNVLGNKVPDSGTTGRAILASLITGTPFAPHVTLPTIAGMGAGAAAYSRPSQNALRAILTSRPESAPLVANYLRRLIGPATLAGVPAAEQVTFHDR